MCEDVWHSDYKGAPTDGSAWLSGGSSSRRILRGGSHVSTAWACRSAFRYNHGTRYSSSYAGFRVVVLAGTS